MEKENSSDFDVELFDLMPINGKKKINILRKFLLDVVGKRPRLLSKVWIDWFHSKNIIYTFNV